MASVAGAAEPTAVEVESSADGHAKLEFDMPKLAGEDAALVIEASRAMRKVICGSLCAQSQKLRPLADFEEAEEMESTIR